MNCISERKTLTCLSVFRTASCGLKISPFLYLALNFGISSGNGCMIYFFRKPNENENTNEKMEETNRNKNKNKQLVHYVLEHNG